MKTSTRTKLLCIILAVLMALSISACGAAPAATSATPAASTETATTAASATTEATAVATQEATPVAQATEPVTLSVLSLPSNTSGLINNWWSAIIKQKCNVELELQPAGDQGEQKLQALMASGELPDIVIFKTKKQVEDAVKAEMLLNLDDNIGKIPNVVKNASIAMQYYRDSASNGTGKSFAVPNAVGPGEVGEELNWGPFLRWDLYKTLGMPPVKTLEDYLPLLKKMQDLEPKNKDGQKVYALQLWGDWDSTQMQQATQPAVLSGIDVGDQFGGSLPFLQVNLGTGATKSVLAPDSEYIRALKFYYQANQMGLVDPDSLTQRFDAALAKVEQGRVLFGWWPWFVGGYNVPANTNAEPFKGFRPVLTEEYKAFWWGENTVGSPWAYGIGAATKNADAALKFMDFMYSTEALMEMNNGPKGVTWDVNDKGEPFVTDAGWDIIDNAKELPGGGKLGDGGSVINSAGLSSATINPEFNQPLGYGFWASSQGRNPTKLMKDWQDTTGFKSTTAMLKSKNTYTVTPLAMNMVPTITDDMQTLTGQIGDVVKTTSWLMVYAKSEAEFDKLYKDMVAKAEGLGIQKVIDWDTAAWKEAQALSVKYAK